MGTDVQVHVIDTILLSPSSFLSCSFSPCQPQMKPEMLIITSCFDYFWIWIVGQLKVYVTIDDEEL